MTRLLIAALVLASSAHAAHINPRGAFVTDAAGAARTAFTSTEQIAMTQTVQTTAEGGTIAFSFKILNPSGGQVFQHSGNTAPGGIGDASTRVAGVPISQFYSVPGQYTLVAEAAADGETPVVQRVPFTITSPILTLLYPPDGVRGLEDRPLVLHWTGSGASRYRIQVSDEASFYRVLFAGETLPGESTFAYPENPSDNRQRLVGGQVYYWRVQGLDGSGNIVAQSGTYSFSLKGSAVGGSTRDLAVILLDVQSNEQTVDEVGAIPFRAVVRNQGSTTETSAKLRFTLGGVSPAKSPFRLQTMAPGEEQPVTFPAKIPAGQTSALAVACLDLFDDSVLNNCKTLVVAAPAASPETTETTEDLVASATTQATTPTEDTTTAEENKTIAAAAWNSLKSSMSDEISSALQGYHAESIEGEGLTAEEAKQLLSDVKKGKATIVEMSVE